MRDHCETEQRDYVAIEKTVVIGLLLARNEAALTAKRTQLDAREPFRGFAGTVSAVTDLVGRYQEAGVQTWICSAFKNSNAMAWPPTMSNENVEPAPVHCLANTRPAGETSSR